MNLKNKYLVAILTIVGTLVYNLQLSLADNIFTPQEQWAFVGLAAGTAASILAPLLQSGWAAGLKVGSSVVVAAVGAIIGVIVAGGVWDSATTMAFVFVVVNALLTQLGVYVRVDDAKDKILDPTVPNEQVFVLDPAAYSIAKNQIATTIPYRPEL